jgi:hypothetical protein
MKIGTRGSSKKEKPHTNGNYYNKCHAKPNDSANVIPMLKMLKIYCNPHMLH